MKYRFGLNPLLFVLLNCFFASAQDLDSSGQIFVSDFINCIKDQNKEKLAGKTMFPLRRNYPIPAIANEWEFLKRYNEVFDDSLTKMIINSDPAKDWTEAGWRGIMLHRGDLWLDEGWLSAVNYQSKFEKNKWQELVQQEKRSLDESIRVFERPKCIIETKKYRIRIDDLGKWNYRYASWPLNRKMSDKPELIIDKGEFIPESSGGDIKYRFKNGDYTYDCHIIRTGQDGSPPALLEIFKDDKLILSQDATTLKD
jgi:hypothetical protein